MTTRRWHELDPLAVILASALGITIVISGATLVVRERIAAIPEIGRATPVEELRAAWAEADDEADRESEKSMKRTPITMPEKKQESRP